MVARPGDIIKFGRYPHSADGADKTPIRWRVLHNTGKALFVLSERILDCKRWHGALEAVHWRDCDLRWWLNHEFYVAAFSAAEQKRIQSARCTDHGANNPDTRDKVFLLSVAEIQAWTDPGEGSDAKIRRRATGTDFARRRQADGCKLYVYDKGVEKDFVTADGERRGCSWWWTRSQLQAEHPERATFIGARSNIKRYGLVNLRGVGVRPALTIKSDEESRAFYACNILRDRI